MSKRQHILIRARVAWAILLCLETLCQVSLKMAGNITGAFDFTPAAITHALGTPWLWVAIACYVGAFAAWMTILRESTLSAAFSTSALVFVAVMLSSWLIFGEHIGMMQWLGSFVIVCGILMLGSDDIEEAAVHPPPSFTGPGRV